MLALIAGICVIASCVFGYLLQRQCKPTSIRYRGRKIEVARKMVVADVYDAFIKNGQYYARCKLLGNEEMFEIPIDKSMMASIPDNDNNAGAPVSKVLLYQDNGVNGLKYLLTPEEIRFKTNMHIIQDEKKTIDDINSASNVINFIYEIRLVMWTVAILGVYSSSIISIFLSVFAAIISYRNIIPLRHCTNLQKRGIISTKINTSSSDKSGDTPPGFDNWTEDEQYLFALEQRVSQEKTRIDSENGNHNTASGMESASQSGTSTMTEVQKDSIDASDSQTDEAENDESDSQEDTPFFTDEELEEDLDTDNDSPVDSDANEFGDIEFEDDEFDADEDKEDVPDAGDSERANPKADATDDEDDGLETKPEHYKTPSPKKGKRKKSIQNALEDLIG